MASKKSRASLEESAVRARLVGQAGAGAEPLALPTAAPPVLDGLTVEAPAAVAVAGDELVARFEALKREHAARRERAPGEALALGDEVVVDVLAWCEGRLVPFSARFDDAFALVPLPHLPGFSENLVGMEVGRSARVALVAPDDYPAEALRGKQLDFVVDVKRAFEVTPPKDDAPSFLAATKRGSSVDEVMDRLAEEAQADEVDRLTLELQERVLDALAERVKVELPEALVTEAIRQRWWRQEGRALVHKGFDQSEQDEALAGWLTDPAVRLDAIRSLRIDVALEALRAAHGVEVSREAFDALLGELAPAFGVTAKALREEAKQDPQVARQLAELAVRGATVELVMSKVKVVEP